MTKKPAFFVQKSTGESAQYSEDKLRLSLLRAGAGQLAVNDVIDELQTRLYDGISTKNIYRIAFSILKKQQQIPVAARYKLKHGIMELGPSGFPFEKFIGEIFKHQGFEVQVGVMMNGACVTHEVDVLAQKDNMVNIVECKYHNYSASTSDVKVPLYVHARFNDVVNKLVEKEGKNHNIYKGWVVTNTDFTEDAIKYGTCSGLRLWSWNYPKEGNLRQIIEHEGLYPLTCLTTLTKVEKQRLLDNKVVLVKELQNNPSLIDKLQIKMPRLKHVMHEINELNRFFKKK